MEEGLVPEPAAKKPRRRILLATAAAIVMLVVVAAVALRPSSEASKLALVHEARPAPTFDLPDLRHEQGRLTLAQFRGKPVVLNFWASWCAPCTREMPAFQQVHEEVGHRVAFVGINHQDGKSAASALLSGTGVTYPSGYDPEGKLARAYGAFGMPVTVFISADGRQLATRTGEMSRSELEDTIKRLFR